jgi:hypothetical protein
MGKESVPENSGHFHILERLYAREYLIEKARMSKKKRKKVGRKE